MTDAKFIASITLMTRGELFQLIFKHPDYLTDSYYGDFGRAIRDQAEKLGVING